MSDEEITLVVNIVSLVRCGVCGLFAFIFGYFKGHWDMYKQEHFKNGRWDDDHKFWDHNQRF